MEQLFQKVPLLVIIFVIISIVRAMNQAKEARQKHEAGRDESAEQKRVREIQERIRRAVAERTGKPVVTSPPLLEKARTLIPRQPDVQPTDPFGGPLRRAFETLERKVDPAAAEVADAEERKAELARQQRLAAEMRALAEARVATERRAANLVRNAKDEGRTHEPLSSWLHENLADPESLRRAIVLREVLGTPVGLR